MPRFENHELDTLIGRKIRQRREDMKLTQTDLAHARGMSFQQIQKYETGKSQIAASLLREISRQLCVPISYFFSESTYQETAVSPVTDGADWRRQVSLHYGKLPKH